MTLRSITVLLLFLLSGTAANAADAELSPGFDWEMASQITVQSSGRVKPLDTFARELVAMIYGKSAYHGQHPTETYFRWMSDGDHYADEKLFYIPKGPLRDEMMLPKTGGNHFAMTELQSNNGLMRLARDGAAADQQGEKPTFVQTKANELLNRMNTLAMVFQHELPLLAPTQGGDPHAEWLSMPTVLARFEDTLLVPESGSVTDTLQALAVAFSGMYMSLRDDRPDMFNTSVNVFLSTQDATLKQQPSLLAKLTWETNYNYLRPFTAAKILLAAALVLFLFSFAREQWSWLKWGGMLSMVGGLVFFTAGLAMRAFISGRAPWSNMYESLLAIGWAAVLISIIYELIKRDRVLALVGSALGALILGVAQFASLDRGINQLVPALQSYWLNYHVIITLASYSCFAIAMGLGHAVLISGVRAGGAVTPKLAGLAKANLKIIQIGTLLLITGILLGAVWANVSWGRFWGWDPKETWALITWFVYIAFLHGRSAGWLGWRGLAAYSVGAFPVVIMTYYGVNYYLSGLHSYGAGSAPGMPWQLFGYVALEAGFLVWALSKLKGKLPGKPRPATGKLIVQPVPSHAD